MENWGTEKAEKEIKKLIKLNKKIYIIYKNKKKIKLKQKMIPIKYITDTEILTCKLLKEST